MIKTRHWYRQHLQGQLKYWGSLVVIIKARQDLKCLYSAFWVFPLFCFISSLSCVVQLDKYVLHSVDGAILMFSLQLILPICIFLPRVALKTSTERPTHIPPPTSRLSPCWFPLSGAAAAQQPPANQLLALESSGRGDQHESRHRLSLSSTIVDAW